MYTPRSTKLAERLIVALCWSASMYFIGYTFGRIEGEKFQQKTCAKVEGEVVISSTAETCTYVRQYGLAIYKRRAI